MKKHKQIEGNPLLDTMDVEMKSEDYGAAYNQLVEAVQNHMRWDLDKTLFWFDTDNPHIGNCSPKKYYKLKPDKCIKWIISMIEENTKD